MLGLSQCVHWSVWYLRFPCGTVKDFGKACVSRHVIFANGHFDARKPETLIPRKKQCSKGSYTVFPGTKEWNSLYSFALFRWGENLNACGKGSRQTEWKIYFIGERLPLMYWRPYAKIVFYMVFWSNLCLLCPVQGSIRQGNRIFELLGCACLLSLATSGTTVELASRMMQIWLVQSYWFLPLLSEETFSDS